MFTNKVKKLHQHFQNDIELALRLALMKTEVIEAFKAWAGNKSQLFEILRTVNGSTYLDSSPSSKARHLFLFEIFNPNYSYRTAHDWETIMMPKVIKQMYLPYAERQAKFVELVNLKIGDEVYISKPENHLYYPFMINIPMLTSLDRTAILTVIDITEEHIIIKTKDDVSLKVPYSIVYKVDGSIIYPKEPKTKP